MLASVNVRLKLRRLIEAWTQYRDAVHVVRDPGSTSPAEEQSFLDLKARVAALLPVVIESAPTGAAPEAQSQSRAMTEMLNKFPSLTASMSDRDREEFGRHWHESFVYLNKLRGSKPHRDKSPSMRKVAKAPTGLPDFKLRRSLGIGTLVKTMFQLGVMAVFLYAVAWFVGLHRDPSGKFALDSPKNLSEVGSAVGQILVSIWGGAASFLSPVIQQHGIESTIVLLGALLVSIGIWVFVRRS